MHVIHKRGWRVCLLDNKKTTWNQLLSKQYFFILQPLSSALLSLSYSTRSLTQCSSSSPLVPSRLRRYCLRDVTHTVLLVHFTNADSAFQIHYSTTASCVFMLSMNTFSVRLGLLIKWLFFLFHTSSLLLFVREAFLLCWYWSCFSPLWSVVWLNIRLFRPHSVALTWILVARLICSVFESCVSKKSWTRFPNFLFVRQWVVHY